MSHPGLFVVVTDGFKDREQIRSFNVFEGIFSSYLVLRSEYG